MSRAIPSIGTDRRRIKKHWVFVTQDARNEVITTEANNN